MVKLKLLVLLFITRSNLHSQPNRNLTTATDRPHYGVTSRKLRVDLRRAAPKFSISASAYPVPHFFICPYKPDRFRYAWVIFNNLIKDSKCKATRRNWLL